MYYRGYKIVKALHPTRLQPGRETYDIKHADAIKKANFATVSAAQWYIDLMIKVGVWKDLKANQA